MQGIGQSVYNCYHARPEELERAAALRLAGKAPQPTWPQIIRSNWAVIAIAFALGLLWPVLSTLAVSERIKMIVFISVWILGSLLSFAIMELLDWSARANKRKRDDLAHATLTLQHAIQHLETAGIGRNLEYARARWIMQFALANVKQEITRRGRK